MQKHRKSNIVQEIAMYDFGTQDLKRDLTVLSMSQSHKKTEGSLLLFSTRLKIKALLLIKNSPMYT